jgi:uncharacterized cupredoxin-like copper-binding protein
MGRLIALLLAGVAASLLLSGCGGGAAASASATIAVRYSHFEPERVTAVAGVPVTITLRNDDPIEHEWMVGGDEMHAAHRTGTEPFHAQIPTEVTIPALSTRVTTVVFEEPGDYKYICHLPGHEEYGMVGTLHVIAR